MVPTKTAEQAATRKTLFSNSVVSRLTGENAAPPCKLYARQANSASAPPMASAIRIIMKKPRVGSLAKACTEVMTPDRTRKVPIKDMEKPPIANNKLQVRKAPLFSVASAECSSAVAISQGISEAFSTGSQPQNPPQPNS